MPTEILLTVNEKSGHTVYQYTVLKGGYIISEQQFLSILSTLFISLRR